MAELNTNPGDRSVSDLEREVDRERERVSATIDELQSRASVGGLFDQVVKVVGENGGEVSRNLGRSLRDNPLAALLTGVGLAWLMAGSGKPRDGEAGWDEADQVYRRQERDQWAVTPGRGASVSAGGAGESWPLSEHADGEDAAGEDGLRERVADMAGRVGGGVAGALGDVRERASDLSHAAGAGLHRAGETLRDAGGAVRHRAGSAKRDAAGAGQDLLRGLDSLMEDQPLVAGAIALALGAAVGGALPRSRIEDRLLGEQSDRAMQAARAFAREQASKAQETASAVAAEAVSIADEVSADLGRKLPSGEEIVDVAEDKVRDAANRLRTAGGLEATPAREDHPAG